MRLLTVPNWSFGRDRALLREATDLLETADVDLHYAESDIDHNRTVTAFSGDAGPVFETLQALADIILPTIDLNRHVGVHPRIGALDVCPFVLLDGELDPLRQEVERMAAWLALNHGVPVYLYEKSEKGRHEADLPTLRKGGFGGLVGKALHPDFGPAHAHERLGLTVMGVRDFLIAMNVDLRDPDPLIARDLAKSIRQKRSEGDPRFLGVRALGFPLASRMESQVSMNLTLPDLTPPDPIIEWVVQAAASRGVASAGTELIGVIRRRDLPEATRLPVQPAQVVDL